MAPSQLKQTRRILVVAKNRALTDFISGALTQDSRTSETVQSSDTAVHRIQTPYFTASVPVWQDEIASPSDWAAEWKAEAGARDVVQAVGAWVVCFMKPLNATEKASLTSLLSSVSDVVAHHLHSLSADYAIDALDPTDVVTLAVAVPDPQSAVRSADPAISSLLSTSQASEAEAELEELCQTSTGSNGDGPSWEYVDGTLGKGLGRRNEFGETMGLDRLLEALKGGEWDLSGLDAGDAGLDDSDFEDLRGADGLGPHQRLDDADDDEARGDEFGDFKGQSQPITTLFDDDFAQDMADGFGNEAEKNLTARTASTEFGTVPESEAHRIARDVQEEEMKVGLLANAQSVAETQPSTGLGPTHAQDLQFATSNDSGNDDPWRIRGKGPAGPSAPGATTPASGAVLPGNDANEYVDADEDDDHDVQLLQDMMLKLQAARDLGADLPMAQRRQIAAKAVREVMRDL